MNRSPRKSAAQWAEIVAEFTEGSEDAQEFCSRHSIKLATLRKWQTRYRPGSKAAAKATQSAFVKININEERRAAPSRAAVLCIGPDIRLECPSTFDVASLAQLALAVHHGR